MKTSRVLDHSRSEDASQNCLSWNKGAQVEVLRVELADGSFYLFPYGQLGFVKFEPKAEGDLLNVRFGRHEVQITGKHLRAVALAFQKLTVEWVRELPARSAGSVDGETACITGIKVVEIQRGE